MFFSRLAVLFAIGGFVIGVLSVLIGTAATMDLLDEVTRARYVIRSPEQIIYGGALGGGERWQLYSIGSRLPGLRCGPDRFLRHVSSNKKAGIAAGPVCWRVRIARGQYLAAIGAP